MKKGVCARKGRIPFSLLWRCRKRAMLLAEAEKQNNNGYQNDPKQNIFAENVASAVHSVTPFFDTEMIFGSLIVYDRKGNV